MSSASYPQKFMTDIHNVYINCQSLSDEDIEKISLSLGIPSFKSRDSVIMEFISDKFQIPTCTAKSMTYWLKDGTTLSRETKAKIRQEYLDYRFSRQEFLSDASNRYGVSESTISVIIYGLPKIKNNQVKTVNDYDVVKSYLADKSKKEEAAKERVTKMNTEVYNFCDYFCNNDDIESLFNFIEKF